MMEIGVKKLYLEDFYYWTQRVGGFTAEVMGDILKSKADALAINLVLNSFKSFLKRNVMQYDYHYTPVHFIGSVAYYYKDVLAQAADEMGIRLGTILKSPMEGLIKYHQPAV